MPLVSLFSAPIRPGCHVFPHPHLTGSKGELERAVQGRRHQAQSSPDGGGVALVASMRPARQRLRVPGGGARAEHMAAEPRAKRRSGAAAQRGAGAKESIGVRGEGDGSGKPGVKATALAARRGR